MTKRRSFEAWLAAHIDPIQPGVTYVGKNYKAIYDKLSAEPSFSGTFLLEGGSRSGKTFDVIRFLVSWASSSKRTGVFLVLRERFTFTKASIYADFISYLRKAGLYQKSDRMGLVHNKSDYTYRIKGITFAFTGADNPNRFMGGGTIGAWVNETIPSFSKAVFDEIDQRCDGFKITDYNPKVLEHWVYKMQLRKDSVFIKSTILDNLYAPVQVAKRIFEYEPTPENIAQGTANLQKWEIYGLGKRGGFLGLIYPNFQKINERPTGLERIGQGLDFGFSNHEAAIVDVYRMPKSPHSKRSALFFETVLYATGQNNEALSVPLSHHSRAGYYTIADSAEAKSIDDLQGRGLLVIGARKGAGSVSAGIDKMNTFDLFALAGDPIIEEAESYIYAPERGDDTKYTNEPAKNQQDHALDAARYAVMDLIY